MRTLRTTAALALAGAALAGMTGTASAATKYCGSTAAAKQVIVNAPKTSCPLGRAAARRVTRAAIERSTVDGTGIIWVRGVKLYVIHPTGRSYLMWSNGGKEVQLRMYRAGG